MRASGGLPFSAPIAVLNTHAYLTRPLRVVHSALCTRVLLNLRKAAAHASGMGLDEFTRFGASFTLDPQLAEDPDAIRTLVFQGGESACALPDLRDMNYFDV